MGKLINCDISKGPARVGGVGGELRNSDEALERARAVWMLSLCHECTDD